MSTRRGSQHRRRVAAARPSGGSWAVMRCPCCAEDNVTWLPDGHTLNHYAATDRCPAHKFRGQWYVDPTWVASQAAQRPKGTQ